MCTRPQKIKIYRDGVVESVPVPCGRCFECLKKKSDDMTVRVLRCNSVYPRLHFMTLTYNNANIPVAGYFCHYDKDTGTLLSQSDPVVLPKEIQASLRPLVIDYRSGRVRTSPVSAGTISSSSLKEIVELNVCPSISRTQVRLWLKGCRTAYRRQFNRPLPEFKYALVGEYGSRTLRPHFHLCIMSKSISDSDMRFLTSRWIYGTTDVRSVPLQDSYKVAKYISKYVSKGSFECDMVNKNLTERPRFCTSKGMSFIPDDLDRLVSFYRGYDFLGEYDPNDVSFVNKLSDVNIRSLINRMHYSVGVFQFSLPKSIKDVCFKVKDEIKGYYVQSALSAKIADYLRRVDERVCNEKLRALSSQIFFDSDACFNSLQGLVDFQVGKQDHSVYYYRALRLQLQRSSL